MRPSVEKRIKIIKYYYNNSSSRVQSGPERSRAVQSGPERSRAVQSGPERSRAVQSGGGVTPFAFSVNFFLFFALLPVLCTFACALHFCLCFAIGKSKG